MRIRRANAGIGLQTKAAIILTLVVLAVTAVSGMLYLRFARGFFEANQLDHADRLANSLALVARIPLAANDRPTLQRIARDLLNDDTVLYVTFLDIGGRELSSASRRSRPAFAEGLAREPISLHYTRVDSGGVLTVARPVVDSTEQPARPVGAVRICLDQRAMDEPLGKVQNALVLLACAIVMAIMPVGYLLVWRVLVQPVRRLMRATDRLAEGDFAARAELTTNDEIGRLAESFNAMAEQLDLQRRQLLASNESLEQIIAERTAELNRVNERLRAEMVEKEDFLRAVSHDLNAPLRNIAGMATMTMMKFKDELPEEVLARLHRITANVETETELINELLELSRIRTCPQRRDDVDMGQLIEQIRGSFDYELRAKGIELRIEADMPTLYVERSRMRQVFQNLIDNAIKYMSDRTAGRIEVSYRRVSSEHVFAVRDNGQGIATENQRKIFDVFRRGAGSGVSGKGVGLASVKSIISNYDGRLWVESGLGEGSTFFVALASNNTAKRSGENDFGDHDDCNKHQADYDLAGR